MTDRLWRRGWGFFLFYMGRCGMSCLSHENNESWVLFWAVSVLEQGREQGCLLGEELPYFQNFWFAKGAKGPILIF